MFAQDERTLEDMEKDLPPEVRKSWSYTKLDMFLISSVQNHILYFLIPLKYKPARKAKVYSLLVMKNLET